MNRPNKELLTEWSLNSYADYTNELEKYCGELEKTLDKACKRLADGNMYIPKGVSVEEFIDWNEQDWKEWLLKDDQLLLDIYGWWLNGSYINGYMCSIGE